MSTSNEVKKGLPCEEGKSDPNFLNQSNETSKSSSDDAKLIQGVRHELGKEGCQEYNLISNENKSERVHMENRKGEEDGDENHLHHNDYDVGENNNAENTTEMIKEMEALEELCFLKEETISSNADDVSPEISNDKQKCVHIVKKNDAEDCSRQITNEIATIAYNMENDSLPNPSLDPQHKHAINQIKCNTIEQGIEEDTTNSNAKERGGEKEVDQNHGNVENWMRTANVALNFKNEVGIQEINEQNNHSDDANHLNKCKGEIDSRIKRKMHSLKQNEEKKKKKTDADNAPSILSDSSDDIDIDSKEKFSDNSTTTALCEKQNKDEKEEKKKKGSKEDHAAFADEILKGYPRIFVTRLPFEAGKKDLEKYFSKYGKIIDIYVSKNLSNNKNKGFGFVSFEKQGSMDKVLKDKLHIICGKEIVVDVASMRDSKTKNLFHLPSDHYLAKYPKNDKKLPNKNHNNSLVNFNKYHHIYNKTTNIRDVSKNIDNNLVMQNFYNLCPTYNILGNRMNNNKHVYKNNVPVSFFPPNGYNMDPTYFNNQQVSYQNCLDYMGNDYYWSMANYYNWNNMMFHNENIYNAKKMEYPPYYVCNGQYMTQGSPPIAKNKVSRKNSAIEENKLKYPLGAASNGNYRSPFVRKLPGGDEWNKRGYKLFVTKLNSVTTIETLRNYFEAFGEIIDIYMPNDVCTNRPRGIAFVTFLDNDCVKKILSNKNSKHIIDGKEVVVDLADPETKTKKNLCYP
ncbi:nucleic acid binding protein [Plasmodium gonderi]|uniref:Nucleic acid binding protein n=1 Tax=Plasmodium gonderi TaxID=77519 RepID=A0A1Y1JE94_PLAGO|nr:nucleic acid binding protein [Plasmodium gonderi]GAW80849.1 nucleic acid binding protein [Plasmodium gonderi]